MCVAGTETSKWEGLRVTKIEGRESEIGRARSCRPSVNGAQQAY